MAKKKSRQPKYPQTVYIQDKIAKKTLGIAVKRYRSLRQVALQMGCSVCHVYRWNDATCRMSLTWYEKLLKLLSQ